MSHPSPARRMVIRVTPPHRAQRPEAVPLRTGTSMEREAQRRQGIGRRSPSLYCIDMQLGLYHLVPGPAGSENPGRGCGHF